MPVRLPLCECPFIAKQLGSLLIVDDIQVGCGRTGSFFSFEKDGIYPDIVCLSKALSGYGLPFAVTLLRPHVDIWEPGEHTGTFRGNNLAFVTSEASLRCFWSDDRLSLQIRDCADMLKSHLLQMADKFQGVAKGRGLIQGISFRQPGFAAKVSLEAFQRGLLVETCGAQNQVLKLLPPLNVSEDILARVLQPLHALLKEHIQ